MMMDVTAIETIMTAMGGAAAAGGLAAVKETTKTAVIDAVTKLRDLIRTRLGDVGDEDGAAEVTIYAKRPSPEGENAIRRAITGADLDADPDILTAARQVLLLIGSMTTGPSAAGPGAIAGMVNQTVAGHGVGFVGGTPTVTINHAQTMSAADWNLLFVGGIAYELRNIGSGDAHDVAVTAENTVRFDPPEGPSSWTAGTGRSLNAVGAWGTGRPVITVTWSDTPGGAWRTWTRSVPS